MQRNTLSPIDFLPDELLGEIFLEVFLLHPDKPYPYGGCSTEFDASWTRLMLVCRRWRQIGLTEHRLWSYISVGSQPSRGLSLGQILARSSHLFLTCRLDLTNKLWDQVDFLLNVHGGRIRGLEVTGKAFQLNAFFHSMSKFPSLRELTARCVTQKASDVHWVPDVLDAIVPQLRALELYNVQFTRRVLSRTNLCSLVLSRPRTDSNSPFPLPFIPEMVSTLRHLPRLTLLKLHNYLREDAQVDRSGTTTAPVNLDHLNHLSLAGSTKILATFLPILTFPSTTTLALFTWLADYPFSPLMIPIHRRLHSSPTLKFRSLSVRSASLGSISIIADVRTHCPNDVDGEGRASFRLEVPLFDLQDIIPKILHALPLAESVTVDIRSLNKYSQLLRQTWRAFFMHTPSISELSVELTSGRSDPLSPVQGLIDARWYVQTRIQSGRWPERLAKRTPYRWPLELQVRHRDSLSIMDRITLPNLYDDFLRALKMRILLEEQTRANVDDHSLFDTVQFFDVEGREGIWGDLVRRYREPLLELADMVLVNGQAVVSRSWPIADDIVRLASMTKETTDRQVDDYAIVNGAFVVGIGNRV